MDRPSRQRAGRPRTTGRRTRAPWLLLTVALVVLGGALVLRSITTDETAVPTDETGEPGDETGEPGDETGEPTDETAAGRGPVWDVERGIGEVVRLTSDAVARVNGIEPDVTVEPGLPQPEAGTRLDRADVEICAGEEEQFVEPAFWVALGDDNAVHSAHMGVRDFRTFTLPPGACQRGYVDLALPEGVGLQAVLLMDHTRTAVAAWAARGEAAGTEPLDSGVESDMATVGVRVQLRTSGAATLHAVDVRTGPARGEGAGEVLVRVDAEVCASEQELLAGPASWFLHLEDHRLVPALREGSDSAPDAVAPGSCGRGTVEFAAPAAGRVAAVVYAFGGVYEEARWRVDG